MWSIFTLHKQRPINLSTQIFQNLYDEILGAWYIPRGGGGVYNWNHHQPAVDPSTAVLWYYIIPEEVSSKEDANLSKLAITSVFY